MKCARRGILGSILGKALLVFILLMTLPCRAVDPTYALSQLGHSAWRAGDGTLNGSSPTSIAQTADGYVWIGTQTGLLRFDGARFVPFKELTTERLTSEFVTSLYATADGDLWIGSAYGLSKWSGGKLTRFVFEGRVNSIRRTKSGVVWFVHSKGGVEERKAGPLCRIEGSSYRCLGADQGFPFRYATALAIDENSGVVWVGSSLGVARVVNEETTFYPLPAMKKLEGLLAVSSLVVDTDGSLIVSIEHAGRGLGVQRLQNGSFTPFAGVDFDGMSVAASSLTIDPAGVLWIGTENDGVYRITNLRTDHLDASNGLGSTDVLDLMTDRDGNAWVVTAEGVHTFYDLSVLSYRSREGLADEHAQYVLALGNELWIGERSLLQQAVSIEGGMATISTTALPGTLSLAANATGANELVLGVDDTVWNWRNGQVTTPIVVDLPGTFGAFRLERESNGTLWMIRTGIPAQVVRQVGGRFGEAPEVADARSMAADPAGGMWFGFLKGVLKRVQGTALRTLQAPEGVGTIKALHVVADLGLLGASNQGLFVLRDGRFTVITEANGLPCPNILDVIQDNRKDLWLTTGCGYVKLPLDELRRVETNAAAKLDLTLFGPLDGVAGMAATSGWPRTAKTADGRIWFVAGGYLQMIDPDRIARTARPVRPMLESMTADRIAYRSDQPLKLQTKPFHVQIDYTAIAFKASDELQFRYRMEGYEKDWQLAGKRRQAFYNDLPAGRYRFVVAARNKLQDWEESPALDIEVPRSWYETWLFRGFCALALVILLWAVQVYRVRQMAALLSATFEERTRIARELHDTLLQTVQSSRIVAQTALSDETGARLRPAIERLSKWLDQAVGEGRAALLALRTPSDSNRDLVERLEDIRSRIGFDETMTCSLCLVGRVLRLPSGVEDELGFIVHELLVNAHQHSKATHVAIRLIFESEQLRVEVEDDGRGINASVRASGKPGHFGLQGMHERATSIGAALDIMDGPASGTVARLTVPFA